MPAAAADQGRAGCDDGGQQLRIGLEPGSPIQVPGRMRAHLSIAEGDCVRRLNGRDVDRKISAFVACVSSLLLVPTAARATGARGLPAPGGPPRARAAPCRARLRDRSEFARPWARACYPWTKAISRDCRARLVLITGPPVVLSMSGIVPQHLAPTLYRAYDNDLSVNKFRALC
jgi:hypothetical protein